MPYTLCCVYLLLFFVIWIIVDMDSLIMEVNYLIVMICFFTWRRLGTRFTINWDCIGTRLTLCYPAIPICAIQTQNLNKIIKRVSLHQNRPDKRMKYIISTPILSKLRLSDLQMRLARLISKSQA